MKYQDIYSRINIIITIIFICVVGVLFLRSTAFHFEAQHSPTSTTLTNFTLVMEDGTTETMEKLHSLSDVDPNTRFTITTTITAGEHESLLIKTVYTGLKLYADEVLIYECGQPDSYPSWLLDPPTLLKVVPLPEDASVLRFEYISPSQRDTVSLPAIKAGDEVNLSFRLLQQNSALFLISFIMLFTGATVFILTLFAVGKSPELKSLLYLGLFALTVGCWGFGECNGTALLVPYPALLYCMACVGLFTLSIPLIRYGLVVLNPKHPQLMEIAVVVIRVAVIIVIMLQLTGIASLSKTLFIFHILTPLGIGTFAITAIWEHFKYHNPIAKRFALPAFVLFLSALMEVANYSLRITDVLSLFFLLGTLIFTIMLGVIGVWYMTDTLHISEEKKRLEQEMHLTNQQLIIQREYFESIAMHIDETKKSNHDVRHHLAVLKGYNSYGEYEKLDEYLDELVASIPTTTETILCENFAINAIAAHYLGYAQTENVDLDVQLDIPENTGRVPTMDLCIIVGNLLENALEACRLMKSGNKYIRIRSRIDGDALSIGVTNSFDGIWHKENDKYLSRKKSDTTSPREGIGLSNVNIVCEKYDGMMQVEINDNVWRTSALVVIE